MKKSNHYTRRQRLLGILIVPVLLLLAACSSSPADIQVRTDALNEQFAATEATIAANEKQFTQLLEESRYSFMADYSDQQQHEDRFGQATAKLAEAKKAYDERVNPLIGNSYDEEKRVELETALTDVELLVAEANTLAADPLAWIERVALTKEQTSTYVENARGASNAIVTDLALLENEALASGQVFPAQVATISTKVAPLEETRDSVLSSLDAVDKEFAKTKPNFADLATSLTEIEVLSASYAEASALLRSDLDDLTVAETHTIVDFRVDSFVDISRTSWDEGSDAMTDVDYEYETPVVDIETANHFAERVGQIVAKYNPGFFSDGAFALEEGVDASMWENLKIDPMADWPDHHTMAEYYVDAIEDVYCQKIKVLRGGEPDSSGRPDPATNYCSQYDKPSEITEGIYWVEADEFNAEAIGMDIYSKVYGDFSDQATTAATPPGMAYVGDPATGEWREDSNGNSFWYYYGQYAFFSRLIGGPNAYHYRSEYDTWNRDYRRTNEPYFATAGGTPRYGANSPQAAARFAGTTYVASGLNDATVRNAGPAARAGGPGNGGK